MKRFAFVCASILFFAGCASAPSSYRHLASDEEVIRIATSIDTYPYNYGPKNGCPSAVCGFEIDLFNAICAEIGVKCEWKTNSWGEIFDGLTKPDAQGKYAYDAIVASVEASSARRPTMHFSARYYTAWHLFVGRKDLALTYDQDGFPNELKSRKLRISTWPGFLMKELETKYRIDSSKVELISTKSDPFEDVKNGSADLAFSFTGTEIDIVKDATYEMKGKLIEVINTDPEGGIGAASRKTEKDSVGNDVKSEQGERIQKIFSEGLVRIREKGIYEKISLHWFNRDIWDHKFGPPVKSSCEGSFGAKSSKNKGRCVATVPPGLTRHACSLSTKIDGKAVGTDPNNWLIFAPDEMMWAIPLKAINEPNAMVLNMGTLMATVVLNGVSTTVFGDDMIDVASTYTNAQGQKVFIGLVCAK